MPSEMKPYGQLYVLTGRRFDEEWIIMMSFDREELERYKDALDHQAGGWLTSLDVREMTPHVAQHYWHH